MYETILCSVLQSHRQEFEDIKEIIGIRKMDGKTIIWQNGKDRVT